MARRTRNTTEQVDSGEATLVPDPDNSACWTLSVDGLPQSYVDTENPRNLRYRYMRRLADVVDAVAPPGRPVDILHLGGGALTLPRYVAATRPGSPQRVVEIDGRLVELVRRALPFDPRAKLRVRVGDAREAVRGTSDGGYDLVVLDVFAGARTPAHLASVEFVREVARVLAPDGRLVANVADGPPLRY